MRILLILVLLAAASCANTASADANPPLPDIPTLLHQVEAHQKTLDQAREDYTFRELQNIVAFDKKGKVRHTEQKEYEDFFVHGHEVQKLIAKDNKPLSPADARKEEDRATKEAEKYAKQPAGTPDKDDVSVSRLLEIVKFSNPRRVQLDGRPAIAIDFVGDPHAKTHGRGEDALRRVSGAVWIDEAAREVARMDATFNDNLHIGFGVLATLEKGSRFSFNQALVHNEAWLPTAIDGHFDAKALMFIGFHINLSIRYDDYRKFGANAIEQPGVKVLHPRP